ncbi:hypothetical protein SDC9_203591 [bioreactor metagenome]|uniref:Uncharacterized protein n=1 Tax=bioreactor metagenome TaxID=1076179 RepID=A0A645IXN8_9ZZZZ
MTGYSLDLNTYLHPSALSAVDISVSGFCYDNEFRPDAVHVDYVLPAETVTVLFLDCAGDQNSVFVRKQAKILHYLSSVDRRDYASKLVRSAPAAYLGLVFISPVRVECPVREFSEPYCVYVCVVCDKGLS